MFPKPPAVKNKSVKNPVVKAHNKIPNHKAAIARKMGSERNPKTKQQKAAHALSNMFENKFLAAQKKGN